MLSRRLLRKRLQSLSSGGKSDGPKKKSGSEVAQISTRLRMWSGALLAAAAGEEDRAQVKMALVANLSLLDSLAAQTSRSNFERRICGKGCTDTISKAWLLW